MTSPITRFRGPYWFLSNFFPTPVYFNGVWYKNSETAYQVEKTLDPEWRVAIAGAATAAEAKKLSNICPMRDDWPLIKVELMRSVLRAKFVDPRMRKKLLSTGDAELVEGNDWGDRFWGRVGNEGANNLGKLLMEVRAELRGRR